MKHFILTNEQVEDMNLWIKEHNNSKCKINKQKEKYKKKGIFPCGGIGQYSLKIVLTNVAEIAFIKCECGKEKYLGEV